MFPKIVVSGTPKSSILMGFSIIFTIHFGVLPLFLEIPILIGFTPPPNQPVTVTRIDPNIFFDPTDHERKKSSAFFHPRFDGLGYVDSKY